jgi:hypothetical protein
LRGTAFENIVKNDVLAINRGVTLKCYCWLKSRDKT